MTNPFEQIEARLQGIESLILDLKQQKTPSEQTTPPDELLNIQQAAKLLSLAVPTIYSKVSKGELPVMKRSKRLYFSRMELMEYLKEGRKKTNTEIDASAKDYLKSKTTS
jgi:excisionase family DNA binding protein